MPRHKLDEDEEAVGSDDSDRESLSSREIRELQEQ